MRGLGKRVFSTLGFALAMTAAVFSVIILRFAAFAPELLHDAFRAIGG